MIDKTWHPAMAADYWNAVAARYLALFRREFDTKPYDQDIIRRFAEGLGPGASVLDAGCGPCGQVARRLADWGATVTGMDISPECVALARREEPALRFDVMDMAEMTYEDARFDGIVAYYALHYLPKSRLSQVMGEFARVLRPGGQLLLVAKDGDGEDWVDDPLGVTGKVFWCALNPEALQVLVAANGFDVIGCKVRAPEANEIAAPRIYVTARRKG